MKKKLKKIPAIKNDIQNFLFSEEGKISKKNVAKIGLALMAMKMTLQPTDAKATVYWTSQHSSSNFLGNHGSALGSAGHVSNMPLPVHTSAYGVDINPYVVNFINNPHGSGGWC